MLRFQGDKTAAQVQAAPELIDKSEKILNLSKLDSIPPHLLPINIKFSKSMSFLSELQNKDS